MSAQHTPGPWRVDTFLGCVVDAGGGPISGPANCTLAAAAPDMLAALQSLVACMDEVTTYQNGGQMAAMLMDPKEIKARSVAAFAAARKAIARATPHPTEGAL